MPEDKGAPPGWPEWARKSGSCPDPPPPGGKAWLDAAKRGDRMAMEPLLREDARVLTYDGKGCSLGFIGHTALHWASSKNYKDLARWLIAEGLSPSVVNNAQSTPLHTAAQNGHSQVASMLLDAGCDTSLKNADGQSAYDVAVERGHSELAMRIHNAGAKAMLPSVLQELAGREETTWKIGEMKKALKLGGVDTDGIAEKAELLKLTQDLVASSGALAQAVTTPAEPSPPAPIAAAAAPAPAPTPPPPTPSPAMASKLQELDDSDEDGDDALAAGAERAKVRGNEAFSKGDFDSAVKQFGVAIRLTPKNHVLYSNRSGAYASLGKASDALSDANKCLELAPQWAKGYGRKGAALVLSGQYKEAMRAYKAGLEVEPGNAGLTKGLADLRASLREGEVPEADGAARPAASSQTGKVPPNAAPSKPPPSRPPPSNPPPTKPVGAAASGPVGQQWIEAAKRGDRPAMEALLAEGGPSLVTYKARGIGHTAMHWAAARGERGIMEWLLGLGADVNARNTSEATPLFTAAGNGQAMSVEWLLAHGADATLKNEDNTTAAAMAKSKGRDDLARLIVDHLKSPVEQQAAGQTGSGNCTTASGNAAAAGGATYEHREEVD